MQAERREKDEAVSLGMSGSRKRKSDEAPEARPAPGDPGWVGRARVPQVDQSDYVRRPEWQTSVAVTEAKKKGVRMSFH